MRKLLLVLLAPLLMGGVGFAAGRLMFPGEASASQKASAATQRDAMLYKMLGRFTIQVLQPDRILYVQIEMDVLIAGATNFERLADAEGRARLRDATISAASDLAETMLWVTPGQEDSLDRQALADQIALKVHNSYPAVRSAQIDSFITHATPRRN